MRGARPPPLVVTRAYLKGAPPLWPATASRLGLPELRDGPGRDRDRGAAGGGRRTERARADAVGAVPDRARDRRRRGRLRSGPARGEARPRGRAGGVPAAAPLGRVDLRELQ